MNAECITMDYLAMVLGGEYDKDNDVITVGGDAPSRGFVLVGTFKGKKHGTNAMQTFEVILYNVAVQPAVDLTLNATDIGSFPLVLDVLADSENRIARLEPKL